MMQTALDLDRPTRTAPDLGWRKFVADNPRGYAEMVGRAHYCVTNHMHVSVYALFEWLRNAGPRWGEGPYAVDHRFTHAARAMLVADYPELEPYLKTRGSHTVLGGAR